MWELLVLLLAVTAGANMTTSSSGPPVPNSLPIGITRPPQLGGLAGPFGMPIVGASGLGMGPRFGNSNLSK